MWRLSQVMWKWSLLSLCSGRKWCGIFEVFWYLWNDVCWPCYKPSYPLQETRCWAALVLCWWLSAPIRIDTQTPTSGQRPPWPWLSSCWSGMFLDIHIQKISIHMFLESLVKKKITLKIGVQAFQIFKFINTLYLSMTIIFILSKVSLTTNNQVWSFAIQKYPFLSVAVCLFSSSEFCESNLQLLFTVLEKSPYPTIRANTIIALGDLTVRFPNLIEPWTPHMYARSVSNCIIMWFVVLNAVLPVSLLIYLLVYGFTL